MKKHSILLFTTLVLASIIYLSGCGDDSPPATNTAPEFEQETYSFTLAENAASGDEIGSVSATDADENATLTYSITTTQTDFAIDDGTGAVTVAEAAALDFESTTSYTLQVQVGDGTDTDAADITVTITDVNESSPEFAFADNATSYSFSLAADAAVGAEVGKISATDSDGTAQLSYTLSGEGAANFEIMDGTNVASGEEVTVTVAANADLTSLVSPVKIMIAVSDGDNMANAEVEITITTVGTGTNAAPVFANTSYSFNVASDAADEAVVGTVSATDLDEGDLLTYSLSGTDAGSFAISNTPVASGEEVSVTVATNADLPSLVSPVALTVEVSDGTDQVTANVEITIVAGNVAPVFDQTAYTFNVAEGAVSGAILGNVSATDSNDGDRLTYSLSGTDADHFAISNTPVASGTDVPITVAASANLSSLTSPVTLIVTATDDETPALTATANVEITIIAGNVAPVFDQTAYTFTIAEGAVSGAILGNVSATDSNAGDRLTYSLSGTDADHFAISNTPVASGTAVPVTVAASANLSSLTSPVTLIVMATDDETPALTATANVEITIVAGNVAPVFDQTDYTFTVSSDAVEGAVLGPVSATDSDAGDLLTYSLSGTDADHFAINNTPVASGTAVPITVASGTNLPSLSSPVTITVTVTDDATPALMATANVEITIIAGNVAPVFDQTDYTFSIDEDAESGDVVDAVSATDSNTGNLLAYTLSGEGADNFAIDNTAVASGTDVQIAVSATAALDFETTTSYTLEVQASDDASPALTATAAITINVGDVNDNDPVFAQASYTFSVDENSPASTMVGMVSATDADAGTTLAYRITTSPTDFDINANGEITVGTSATLDFETTTSYTLGVQASDGTKTATADVTINVNDLNEAPTFTGAPYTFSIDENSATSTVVDVVVATDVDTGTTLEYSIVPTQTDFDINANTGEITVASASLDFETTTSYTLDVQASDGATPALTATAAVTINVNDVNDAPAFPQTSYDFTVVMGAPVGRVLVGTALAATDEDAGDMANLTYSLVATNDNFEVATDGTISVKSGATLGDVAATHTFMVQVQDDDTPPLIATASVTVTITARIDYDLDDDRLIDINNLEQLNAMRWDLDGDGVADGSAADAYAMAYPDAAAFPTEDDTKPIGYELLRSLDFDAADSHGSGVLNTAWSTNTGAGWNPIGDFVSETNNTPYTATFDGDEYTISNLYITRNVVGTAGIGLFATISATSTVSNVGLVGVAIDGLNGVGSLVGVSAGAIRNCYATGTIDADNFLGGLVGQQNSGTITACYVTGNVTGMGGRSRIGGLVGGNSGTITACYATGNVTGMGGTSRIGGLVGRNSGTITACYATGNVTGTLQLGSLVGESSGTITACYGTGVVSVSSGAVSNIGGLVGLNNGGTVTASYYDSETTDQADTGKGTGQTTSELQTPTAYDDNENAADDSSIYETWNADIDTGLTQGIDDATAAGDSTADDPWDFGTSSQYPVLKVDFNGDGTATVAEFGTQPRG